MCQHDPRVRIEQAHVGVPASFSPRGTHRKWGLSVGCKENGRQRPRSLVSRPQQSSLYWALKCTLQIARPAILVSIVLAQLLEPPCTDPYARWCGRGGAARLPPIPIAATSCCGPNAKCGRPVKWSAYRSRPEVTGRLTNGAFDSTATQNFCLPVVLSA